MSRRLSAWSASSAWSRQMAKQAVLLLAHGTPETVAQIPEYLRNVTSGRPLPQAVIEEIQHRYSLIGHSPLTEITMEQARVAKRFRFTWACGTGDLTFPMWCGRCGPTALKRLPGSAWRRRIRAPAWAFTGALPRQRRAACASISLRVGRSIRCLQRPLPSGSVLP